MRLVLIGLVAGFFSTLLGVGGGLVIVPLLLLLCRWDIRAASATSLAAIAVTATVGVVIYALHGEVRPLYALLVGIPAAVGALSGTWLQQRVPVRTLSLLFSALLVGIATEMLLR